jgi:hypothetical protein
VLPSQFVASYFKRLSYRGLYSVCVCVCVCVCVVGGGEVEICIGQFFTTMRPVLCILVYRCGVVFAVGHNCQERVSKRSSRFVDAERRIIEILDGQRISFSVPLKLRNKWPQKEVIRYFGHFIISWKANVPTIPCSNCEP